MRPAPMRTWELTIDLDRGGALPPFLQIARSLAADIRRGRLRPGQRLPGSRKLAATLNVHRNTVLAALSELAAEGWIETAAGRGTFVMRNVPDSRGRPFSRRLLRIGSRTPPTISLPLPSAPAAYRPPLLPPGALNLSSGAPDLRLVPARAIGRAYRRALAQRGAELLGYGDPEGLPELRSALAAMLASTRGLSVTAADVLITRGSQMALGLVARALLQPGDVVAAEELGYRPAWEAFRSAGAAVVPVAVDRDGIDVRALKALAQQRTLRAIYVTPHHQYPTTVPLSPERRIELLELARTAKIAIIEDDYDHEFQYDGRPLLPLASADHAGVVVYIGTLSKVLAPGLRIGYIAASRQILASVGDLRSLLDTQGDRAVEAAVAALMEEGELQRHIARMRRIYANRREILAASLRRTFGDQVEFAQAPGGMALWVHLLMSIDIDAWSRRSIQHGVSWHPGKRYAFDGQPRPYARMSFAWLNEHELPEAVTRMARAMR
jgi:GntR family transcriptional regulator / MocR family aminotransferase